MRDYWFKKFMVFKQFDDLPLLSKTFDLAKLCEEKIFKIKHYVKLTDIIDASTNEEFVKKFRKRIDPDKFPVLKTRRDVENGTDVHQFLHDQEKLKKGEFLIPERGRKLKRDKPEEES